MSPIATEMGYTFDVGPTVADRTARLDYLCRLPVFHCPENDLPWPPYGGTITITTQAPSYVTASMFLYEYKATAQPGDPDLTQSYIQEPGYSPKIQNVGVASEKIFMAEGTRWCNSNNSPPNYDDGIDGDNRSPGGSFADFGPWSLYTRAYYRVMPNTTVPITYSMRHGTKVAGASLSAYRFNAVFFDGHAETLDGRTGMNPRLWMPKGSILPGSECSAEAKSIYMTTDPLIIP